MKGGAKEREADEDEVRPDQVLEAVVISINETCANLHSEYLWPAFKAFKLNQVKAILIVRQAYLLVGIGQQCQLLNAQSTLFVARLVPTFLSQCLSLV